MEKEKEKELKFGVENGYTSGQCVFLSESEGEKLLHIEFGREDTTLDIFTDGFRYISPEEERDHIDKKFTSKLEQFNLKHIGNDVPIKKLVGLDCWRPFRKRAVGGIVHLDHGNRQSYRRKHVKLRYVRQGLGVTKNLYKPHMHFFGCYRRNRKRFLRLFLDRTPRDFRYEYGKLEAAKNRIFFEALSHYMRRVNKKFYKEYKGTPLRLRFTLRKLFSMMGVYGNYLALMNGFSYRNENYMYGQVNAYNIFLNNILTKRVSFIFFCIIERQ